MNPTVASQPIFLKYQVKLIFSIPITATQAADPIMIALPPVPVARASRTQNGWSFGKSLGCTCPGRLRPGGLCR